MTSTLFLSQMYDMKLDKGEVHIRKSNPESTVWDDGEEPVSNLEKIYNFVHRNLLKLILTLVRT